MTSSRRARRAGAWARARASGVPPAVARGVSPELAAAAEGLADGRERVIADDPMAAVSLKRLAKRRPVIYSAHNLESAFRPGRDPDWGSRDSLEAFERRLLETASETWMPSRADLEGARRLAPRRRAALRPERGRRGGDRSPPRPRQPARGPVRRRLQLRPQPRGARLPARGGDAARLGAAAGAAAGGRRARLRGTRGRRRANRPARLRRRPSARSTRGPAARSSRC